MKILVRECQLSNIAMSTMSDFNENAAARMIIVYKNGNQLEKCAKAENELVSLQVYSV